MNQVTNLIQWKNLTQEQKDEFDFEGYRYEVQRSTNGVDFYTSVVSMNGEANPEKVYRLVIEDDKWYTGFINGELVTCIGSCFDGLKPEILRPAHLDEIPQDERTLERKIEDKWPDKKVVMLKERDDSCDLVINIAGLPLHINAQSMKGFHTYVYQRPQDDSFFPDTRAVYCWNEFITLQPVAVLFEAQK